MTGITTEETDRPDKNCPLLQVAAQGNAGNPFNPRGGMDRPPLKGLTGKTKGYDPRVSLVAMGHPHGFDRTHTGRKPRV